jgi:hypothetical protein
MVQKMARFAQLGATISRQDEPIEVSEVGLKREANGRLWGAMGGMSFGGVGSFSGCCKI